MWSSHEQHTYPLNCVPIFENNLVLSSFKQGDLKVCTWVNMMLRWNTEISWKKIEESVIIVEKNCKNRVQR